MRTIMSNGIKCGKCQGYHETISGVKACYAGETVAKVEQPLVKSDWPPSEAQIKYVLGLQRERELPDEYEVMNADALAALDKAQVSRMIQELKVLPYKQPKGTDHAIKWEVIIEGRYALHWEDEGWFFYEVTKGKANTRWDGYTFIRRLIGAPGAYKKINMKASDRDEAFAAIEENPKQAMLDYGLHSGVCGRCSSPLSDPESLARGIGPKCASKMGW